MCIEVMGISRQADSRGALPLSSSSNAVLQDKKQANSLVFNDSHRVATQLHELPLVSIGQDQCRPKVIKIPSNHTHQHVSPCSLKQCIQLKKFIYSVNAFG